jgi:hypothetical protein
MHELSPELVLELPQALAHAGRRQAEPLRRSAEVKLLGESEKDPKFPYPARDPRSRLRR